MSHPGQTTATRVAGGAHSVCKVCPTFHTRIAERIERLLGHGFAEAVIDWQMHRTCRHKRLRAEDSLFECFQVWRLNSVSANPLRGDSPWAKPPSGTNTPLRSSEPSRPADHSWGSRTRAPKPGDGGLSARSAAAAERRARVGAGDEPGTAAQHPKRCDA